MVDSSYIHIQGNGTVDGQGYWWWVREFMVQNPSGRPMLVNMTRVTNALIEGVTWMNSPMYHFELLDIDNFIFQDMEIYVDIWEQKRITKLFGMFDAEMDFPMFPLNTDGIDPAGSNVIIRRVKITTFDDAVAVKPTNKGYSIAKCAENILVEDSVVVAGVGMTIGSVPPHPLHNCVRNVTFRNIEF